MASQNGSGKDRRRRRLTAQEKYQVWLEVVAREVVRLMDQILVALDAR